ncbi:hypothetical protein COE91_22800 [Bacillus toyonensis]|nr:hypothetical protein COE91_22800 [Bacillus toyonensis]
MRGRKIYTKKLVNHTNSEESWLLGIGTYIQLLYAQCMEGSLGLVVVVWGTGVITDNVVLRFVEDVEHSYIQQQMPGASIKEYIGGHTRHQNGIAGSEGGLAASPPQVPAPIKIGK